MAQWMSDMGALPSRREDSSFVAEVRLCCKFKSNSEDLGEVESGSPLFWFLISIYEFMPVLRLATVRTADPRGSLGARLSSSAGSAI